MSEIRLISCRGEKYVFGGEMFMRDKGLRRKNGLKKKEQPGKSPCIGK